MKKLYYLAVVLAFVMSCQIVEEYTFQTDGSGTYEMVFDMSELSGMAGETDSLAKQPIDTVVVFADLLDAKKDSISKLDEEEQVKLEMLRPMQVHMKVDDAAGEMVMRLRYDFEDLEALNNLGEALEAANLEKLSDTLMGNTPQPGDAAGDNEEQPLFDMVSSFNTEFSAKKFKRSITAEAREKQLKDQDTTLKADDPFADMIRYKQVFKFPYRVKAVDNEKARILTDFQGVEIEANLFEMNQNPDVFNLEVVFEE